MQRILGAGAVLRDDEGRFLLVLRGSEPEKDRWTVPGGHVEPDETLQEAAQREVREETGLDVVIGAELGVFDIPNGDGVIEAHDFAAMVSGGDLAAGDDAADVGWFSPDQMREMPLTTDLLESLVRYGVLAG